MQQRVKLAEEVINIIDNYNTKKSKQWLSNKRRSETDKMLQEFFSLLITPGTQEEEIADQIHALVKTATSLKTTTSFFSTQKNPTLAMAISDAKNNTFQYYYDTASKEEKKEATARPPFAQINLPALFE